MRKTGEKPENSSKEVWVCSTCLVRPVCEQACPDHWRQLDSSIEVTVFGDRQRKYLWNGEEVVGVLLASSEKEVSFFQ